MFSLLTTFLIYEVVRRMQEVEILFYANDVLMCIPLAGRVAEVVVRCVVGVFVNFGMFSRSELTTTSRKEW